MLGRAGLGWAGLGWAGLGWAGLGWAGQGRAGQGRAEQTDCVDISEAAGVIDFFEDYVQRRDATFFFSQANLHNCTTWSDGRQCCLQQSDRTESRVTSELSACG